MDYEKAYKEALKRADTLTEKYGGRDFAEYVFPELKESEDERIRKVIYKLMLGMREEIFTSQDEIVTKEKALAYLEKKSGIKIWPHPIKDAYLEQQEQNLIMANSPQLKEQKPKCTAYLDLSSNEFEACMLRYLQSAANRKDDATIMIDTKDYAAQLMEIARKEQQPAEWSEEDIDKMVNKRARKSGTTKTEMQFYRQGIEDTLKNFGPSWKPSKEQMEALKWWSGLPSCSPGLKSLYEDLKKL